MSGAEIERMLSCDAKRDNQDEDHEWDETFYEFCICKEGTIQLHINYKFSSGLIDQLRLT